jgi:hypothetical protein
MAVWPVPGRLIRDWAMLNRARPIRHCQNLQGLRRYSVKLPVSSSVELQRGRQFLVLVRTPVARVKQLRERITRPMLIRISTAVLTFVLAGLSPVHGQDQPTSTNTPGPIVTDRPTVTNSSVVVPSGSLQVETGFLATNNQGQNVADGPETLVRFGIAARTELRFTAPDYYYNLNASGVGSGFGDSAIGVKEQLGPTPGGFDVSATLFLSCPTGTGGVSSGGYDPGLQVAWSHPLSAKWTIAGMLSLYGPTQAHIRNLTGESTLL